MSVTEEVSHPLMSPLKIKGTSKHRSHGSDRRGIPFTEVSVKYTGLSKHIFSWKSPETGRGCP